MIYTYELNSSQPKHLVPFALLTFERNKMLSIQNDDTLINPFDIDSKLSLLKDASSEDSQCGRSKSRVYYEHTGRLNVKFRGMTKLKIKLTDLLKSNMKFLDQDKTSISLKNSTNRLLLTYMDKRTVKPTPMIKQQPPNKQINGNCKRIQVSNNEGGGGGGGQNNNIEVKKQAIQQHQLKLVNKKVFSIHQSNPKQQHQQNQQNKQQQI